MATSAIPLSRANAYDDIDKGSLWLRNKRWDLFFLTLSVVVVPLPYALYLLGVHLGADDDASRNMVNFFVAVAIGGPHMMSTFLRTGLDERFKERYPTLIRSSIIIPVIVISLAFLNLSLMLTFFFSGRRCTYCTRSRISLNSTITKKRSSCAAVRSARSRE